MLVFWTISLKGVCYKMSMRRSQRYRQLRLLSLLKSGKMPTVRHISDMLEVSQRTVYRDIEELRDDWGAPIEYDRHSQCYKLTPPDWQPPFGTLRDLQLSTGEGIALLLSLHAFQEMHGTGFEMALRSMISKLPSLLPEPMSIDPETLSSIFSFSFEPLRGDAKKVYALLDMFQRAIKSESTLIIEYASASSGKITKRELEPFHLRYFEGAWYVVGYCYLRQEIRTFAIDRICEIKETGKRFSSGTKENFNPDTYFGSSWRLERGDRLEKIVLRFTPEQARYIRERTWHTSQKTYDEEDGSLILEFYLSGTAEIKRWLMQFGAQVEVLEPFELRDSVVKEAEKMLEMYGGLSCFVSQKRYNGVKR